MSRLLYYLIIKPASFLPLSVLYYVSDLLFFVFFRLLGFRKKVVLKNLQNSFPKKKDEEIQQIMEGFYRHLCDIIVEFIRLFSMPKEEAIRRCRVTNPELLNALYERGKSVMIAAGHYNNWEIVAVAADMQVDHHGIGIYHPLSNKFFNEKFIQSRTQYGMGLLTKKDTKAFFKEKRDRPVAIILGTDQSPHNPRNAYWTYFLNQETPVMFGTEKYAKENDYPVVFGWVKKVKRGYYELTFELITDQPADLPYGAISERHTRMLEQEIMALPQYWLWSHRRWKRQRPADISIASEAAPISARNEQ